MVAPWGYEVFGHMTKGAGAVPDIVRLSHLLTEMSRTGLVEGDLRRMLGVLCRAAIDMLEVCGAAVLLGDKHGHLRCAAASDDALFKVEAQQVNRRQELSVQSEGEPTFLLNLDRQVVQPFASHAITSGMQAGYSFPMRAGERRVGMLNLYRDARAALPSESRVAARALAELSASVISLRLAYDEVQRLSEQLQQALESRILIEQAKGVLSVQLGVPPDFAFQGLRRYARSHRERIREVAKRVIACTLPLEELRAEVGAVPHR